MKTKASGESANQNPAQTKGEHRLAGLSMQLVRSDLAWIGRGMLKMLRLAWHDRQIPAEHATTADTPVPHGPFKMTRPGQLGDLLIWVPRHINSYLIDDLTGGYGYSHTTIDMGEIDMPSQKPVMAEITVGQTVTRKFIDEYGPRPYVRIRLGRTGMNMQQLVQCVNSKMGEQYDMLDVFTLGEIEDPAKEVCSGLVADCLPDEELREIARVKKLGLLHRGSVSVHSKLDAPKMRAFVSPNGFAEYYGAPKGRKVTRPETIVEPKPVGGTVTSMAEKAARRQGWKLAAAVVGIAMLGWIVARRRAG
jgi:hypothetical protein